MTAEYRSPYQQLAEDMADVPYEPANPYRNWTRATLEQFKAAHTKARDIHLDSFDFEGVEFATGYAKYLIEYIETVLQTKGQ